MYLNYFKAEVNDEFGPPDIPSLYAKYKDKKELEKVINLSQDDTFNIAALRKAYFLNGKDAKHSKGIFGNNIVITGNNNVVVNGKSISNLNNLPDKEIKVEIIGDVKRLETANGNIKVSGNVNEVKTVNGDVEVGGSIEKVKTVNGDIIYKKK